jgi:hypothetical protein
MHLLDKNDKEILKFFVDFGNISYLGKDLRRVSIYYYPIIIFEFMTGYFTTNELFIKNRDIGYEFAKDFEIMDIPKDIMKNMKSSLQINKSKSSNIDIRDFQILSASTMLPSIKEKEQEQFNENNITKKNNTNPDTKANNIKSNEFKIKLDPVHSDNTNILNSANTILGTSPANEIPAVKMENKDNLSKSTFPEDIGTKKKNRK